MAPTSAHLLMAASLVALIAVVIVFILCERHLMAGLRVFNSAESDTTG